MQSSTSVRLSRLDYLINLFINSEALLTQHGYCAGVSQATVSEGLAQGPYVAARVEPMTLRTKGIDSTNAPSCPTSRLWWFACSFSVSFPCITRLCAQLCSPSGVYHRVSKGTHSQILLCMATGTLVPVDTPIQGQ